MAAARISRESSIWDFKDTLFRALGAAYAALGEASFRSQLTSIAAYYGEGVTIHEIETLFTKDVAKKAEQLKRELASRHGYDNDRALRDSGRSHRPPLLSFDDEDLSVLNPREIEVLKARSNNSLRAPAKRPRVVGGLVTAPPPTGDVPAGDDVVPLRREPNISKATASEAAKTGPGRAAVIPDAPPSRQNMPDASPREGIRKRRFSEIHDPVELQTKSSPRPSPPPRVESFGYVTKNGEYRCALCQTQLPNVNDLQLHEKISKEHIRSLKDKRKVTIGRERLAYLIATPAKRHNARSSAFGQRLKLQDLLEVSPQPAAVESVGRKENGNNGAPVRLRHDREAPHICIDEERQPPPHPTPIQQSIEHTSSASSVELLQNIDKGKCRATSVVSLPDETPSARATAAPAAEIHTRPTTARTEIGTLNTPHVPQYVDSAAAQQSSEIETRSDVEVTEISSKNIKDVVRSTQLAIKVLETFQKCASASIKPTTTATEPGAATLPNSGSETLYTGLSISPMNNSAVPTTVVLETLDGAPSSAGLSSGNRLWTHGTISAPGIGVRVGVKRGAPKENGKKKDVGEPISVIVLD